MKNMLKQNLLHELKHKKYWKSNYHRIQKLNINVDKRRRKKYTVKKIMTENKATWPFLRNRNWRKIKIETEKEFNELI